MRIQSKEQRDQVIRYLVGRGCNEEKLRSYTYKSLSEIYTDAIDNPSIIPSTIKGKKGTIMTQARKKDFLLSKGVKQIDLDKMTAQAITSSYVRHGGKPGTLNVPLGTKRVRKSKYVQALGQSVIAEKPESVLFEPVVAKPKPVVINDAPSILEVLLTALVDTKITVYTTHLETSVDTNWSRTKSDKYIDRKVVVTIHDIRKSDKYFYVCFKESGFDFEMMLY